jgi:hypothetical protein
MLVVFLRNHLTYTFPNILMLISPLGMIPHKRMFVENVVIVSKLYQKISKNYLGFRRLDFYCQSHVSLLLTTIENPSSQKNEVYALKINFFGVKGRLEE